MRTTVVMITAICVMASAGTASAALFYEDFNGAQISGTLLLGTQFTETTSTTDAAVQVITGSSGLSGDKAVNSPGWGSGSSGQWGEFSAPLAITDLATANKLIFSADIRQSATSRVDLRVGSMYVLNAWNKPILIQTPGGNYTASGGALADSVWRNYRLEVDLDTGKGTLYINNLANSAVTDVQTGWTHTSTLPTTIGFRIQGSNVASIDNMRIETQTINLPEPATMSLLAFGGLAALIRRRRV